MSRSDVSARQSITKKHLNDPLKETQLVSQTVVAIPIALPARAADALGILPLDLHRIHELVEANNLHGISHYVTTTFQKNIDKVSDQFVRRDYYYQWITPFNPAYHPELGAWKHNALETLSCIPKLTKHAEYQRLSRYISEEMDYAQRTKAKYYSTLRSRLGIHATQAPPYEQHVLDKLSPEQMASLHQQCLQYLDEVENG